MAAGTWQIYSPFLEQLLKGEHDFDPVGPPPRYRMILVTSAYTPSKENHDTYSDLSANEVANGNGYVTFGKRLVTSVTRPGSPSDEAVFDVDDQSWTSSTITAKYAVIVEDGNNDDSLGAGDLLVCYLDLDTGGGSVSTTNGTFQITIDPAGVFSVKQI